MKVFYSGYGLYLYFTIFNYKFRFRFIPKFHEHSIDRRRLLLGRLK
jgi:hypothetical protein